MRELKIEQLTTESFSPFGSYAMMLNPETDKLGAPPIEFFRDMVQLNLGGAHLASFSVCRVEKRADKVDVSEYHSTSGEGILPLDNDVLIHVAPASTRGDVPLDQFRVFRIPRGTFVALKPGVWHHAPILIEGTEANVLIVLPERAYANDCEVVRLEDDDQLKIIA